MPQRNVPHISRPTSFDDFKVQRGINFALTEQLRRDHGLWTLNRRYPPLVDPKISPLDYNILSDRVMEGLRVATCLPWPYSVDAAGLAFPTGLVGVLCRAELPTGGIIKRLIAVPSTLPAGYTVRRRRDQHLSRETQATRPFSFFTIFFGVGGSLQYHRDIFQARDSGLGASNGAYLPPECDGEGHLAIRDPGARLQRYRWWPQCDDDTVDSSTQSVGDSFANNSESIVAIGFPLSFSNVALSPGWRNITISNVTGATATTTTVKLLAFPNGDHGAAGVVVATFTISNGVASATTLGACNAPTLGVMADWAWEFSGVAPRKATSFLATYHPRVDVPLPFFTTGSSDAGDHLRAPGGIVAGALPGY